MIEMKPIQTSLKRWMDDNQSFKERHEAMKKKVLQHPKIAEFLKQHLQITDKEIDKRLNKLYEYTTQSVQCSRCKNYHSCKNLLKGYSPILEFVNGEIHIAYEKCTNHLYQERMEEKQNLVKSIYMPKEILNARMENLFPDHHRAEAIKEADLFISNAEKRLPQKGLYLAGPFGVGKTYLLGAIANELRKLDISSMLIYMPEFVREIREAIQDNTVQEKINIFKQADVLMLDDIGAETLSAWFRDEVLGSILQYRMMEQLPVFFTSNYTMNQLQEILATSTKNGVEEVKAGRIMERIRQVSKEIKVDGKNHRNFD